MKFELSPETVEQIADRLDSRIGPPRTGIHQSDLNGCLAKAYLNKMSYQRPSPKLLIKFAIGEVLHSLMQSEVAEVSVEKEGIWWTVDEVGMEFKTTRMGQNRLAALYTMAKTRQSVSLVALEVLEVPTNWLRQIMSYAYVWNRKTFYMGALFVNGNYNSKKEEAIPPSFEPTLEVFKITFDDKELRDNWAWYKSREAVLSSALKNKVEPSVTTRAYDWECNDCQYYLDHAEKLVQARMMVKRGD